MSDYAGSRANALINSKVIEQDGTEEEMNAAMDNANDEIINLDAFPLKAAASEHNHATKRQFK